MRAPLLHTLSCRVPCPGCSLTQMSSETQLCVQFSVCAVSQRLLVVLQEGKQASLAADFSITQFRHIGRLLMVHGRNSYKRSAALGQFVMHRGLIISTMQVACHSRQGLSVPLSWEVISVYVMCHCILMRPLCRCGVNVTTAAVPDLRYLLLRPCSPQSSTLHLSRCTRDSSWSGK